MGKGVKWDEENLETNEQNRTATMKIDEPPTPFNFEYCDDEVDEEDERRPAQGPKQGASEDAVAPAGKPKGGTLSFAEQWEKAGMEEIVSDPDNLGKPAFESAPMTPEEEAEAKRKFEENRKKHYSMKEALAMKVVDDDDAEDEDEQDHGAAQEQDPEDAEAKEAKRQEFARKRKAFYQEKDREAAERARLSQDMEGSDSDAEK